MRDETNAGQWTNSSVRDRCEILRRVPGHLAGDAEGLIEVARTPMRHDVETVTAELIPLADGLAWLAKNASKILADRHLGARGRPVWLWGVESTVQRRPLGRVLILGTWNYPILLAGIQTGQALAAGNEVWIKPAVGTEAVTQRWGRSVPRCWRAPGLDPRHRFDDPGGDRRDRLRDGFDCLDRLGSHRTGRRAAGGRDRRRRASSNFLAATRSSRCPGPMIGGLAAALAFGLRFNSGATCIGPRRLICVGGRPGAVPSLVEQLRRSDPVAIHPAALEPGIAAVESAIGEGAVDLIGRFDAAEARETSTMMPVVLERVPPDHAIAHADVFVPVLSLFKKK